jgi:hypothetical protein
MSWDKVAHLIKISTLLIIAFIEVLMMKIIW